MIVSMTGFGDASADAGGTHYAVEVRSVNNRYFKPVLKVPDALGGLEPQIESLLRRRLGRGSVNFTLKLRLAAAAAALEVNVAAVDAYLDQLAKVRQPKNATVDLAALLQLPGSLQDKGDETDAVARHGPAVMRLAGEAIDGLMAFRAREGRGLFEELMKHVGLIERSLAGIAERAPGVIEAYHKRLATRVNELIHNAELRVAEADLIREVAVFAERADIAEELQRLGHHLRVFRHEAEHGEQPGRKLDFLTQEMLREANTIGSKANDGAIAACCVEIKGAIDRLKEQVQNVE